MIKAYRVDSDGELREIHADPSCLRDDEAIIIVDEKEKIVHCWKGTNTDMKKRFNAGKAATNLNAQAGLTYKIKHIESGERGRAVREVFETSKLIKASTIHEIPTTTKYCTENGDTDTLVLPSSFRPKDEPLVKPSERIAEIEAKNTSSSQKQPATSEGSSASRAPTSLSIDQIGEELLVQAFAKAVLEDAEIRKRVMDQVQPELLIEAFARAIVEDAEIRKRVVDRLRKLT